MSKQTYTRANTGNGSHSRGPTTPSRGIMYSRIVCTTHCGCAAEYYVEYQPKPPEAVGDEQFLCKNCFTDNGQQSEQDWIDDGYTVQEMEA